MYKKLSIICVLLSSSFLAHALSNSELERIVTAQGQLLTQNQQQISDLQREVDVLRGQLDETTYKLEQTVERQKMILQQIESGNVKSAGSNTSSTATQSKQNGLAGWSPTGDDKTDYNYIIGFVLEGKDSKNAIVAFQQFIKQYPKSSYLANVNYWLGQLNYVQGQKSDASYYFASVVKNYPKSAKAGESMYKIGLILLEQGDKGKAKTIFQQVISQYPNDKSTVEQAKQKLASL